MDPRSEYSVVVSVVSEGNFSAAARKLAMTPSAVSKLVSRVEDRLGVLLFNRSGASVTPTAEGRAFHEAALQAIDAIEATEASVFAGKLAQDTLRIRSMPAFAVAQLAPVIPEFCRRHPAIQLDIHLSMDPGNPLGGGVDIAIHVGPLPDSSLIARRFSGTRWIICAAPSYLDRHGTPLSPADLSQHQCLNFTPSIVHRPWSFKDGDGSIQYLRISGRIVANQSQMLHALVCDGAGIAQLTEFAVREDLRTGRLVELFPDMQNDEIDPIYAIHRTRKFVPPKVRVFLDYLEAAFKP
ncbi:LysR family transcriptional regulator [Pararhizobium qamdonense]|uniref:LysR family transcriptional regulator n=1 Tax=Pararhizobium qamdonense TaxID=3031126 RepID=UPI0023E23823|nr:LysR family transcriptional regulator [Pararhizobium qamdonense]